MTAFRLGQLYKSVKNKSNIWKMSLTSDIVSFMLFPVKKIWLIMLLISFLFLVISNGIF